MPRVFEGSLDASPGRIGIVASRYNETITGKLLAGAVETLTANGVSPDMIDVAWVPGAFEIPSGAACLAKSMAYSAILCFGAVIRGETTHDQHINRAVSMGIMELGIRSGIPVLFGLLTCDTLEQALARAGGSAGNKGSECAEAALRMTNLYQRVYDATLNDE
ncbi:MAG: 6,7-dimethyl-8-ribityllumazine synthase [Pirellulales bacterium]